MNILWTSQSPQVAVFLICTTLNLPWTCNRFYLSRSSIFGFIHFIDYSSSPFPCQPAGIWVVDIRVSIRRGWRKKPKGCVYPLSVDSRYPTVKEKRFGCGNVSAGKYRALCFIFLLGGLSSGAEGPCVLLAHAAGVVIESLPSVQLLHLFTPAHPAPSNPRVSRSFGRAISFH